MTATTKKVTAVTVGGIIAGVGGWLLAHFDITGKDAIGQGIITLIAYLAAALTHGKGNGNGTPPPPPVSRFGAVLLLVGLGVPGALHAQADTTKRYRVELGADAVMRTDSVTEPQSVRAGLLLGTAFTVEYRASAARASEGYFEATADLGVTAALFPGSTNRAGQYVEPVVSYHYEGGPAQLGVGVEAGTRTLLTNGTAVRASMFTTVYLGTSRLPGVTSVGARVGVSFWR